MCILRVTTGVKVKNLNGKLRDSALIMTVELNKARAAYNESQRRQGKPVVQDQYVRSHAGYQSVNQKGNDTDALHMNYGSNSTNVSTAGLMRSGTQVGDQQQMMQ